MQRCDLRHVEAELAHRLNKRYITLINLSVVKLQILLKGEKRMLDDLESSCFLLGSVTVNSDGFA